MPVWTVKVLADGRFVEVYQESEHGIPYAASKDRLNTEFLPEAKRVAEPEHYNELTRKYLESDVRHEWSVARGARRRV